MENEITNVTMENQETENEAATETPEEGAGIGVIVLAGAVIVGLGLVAYKLGKKVIENIKAKKESKEDGHIEADGEVR